MTKGLIKSSQRTLALFELFGIVQKPLTLTEISTGLEMPQSSTTELVRSLISLGYIEHDPANRTYYPTIRISLLSTWINMRHKRSGQLPELFMKVADAVDEIVMLTMQNEIFSQSVLVRSPEKPSILHFEGRMTIPMACCASGRALLSKKTDEEIGKIIRRTIAETTNKYWKETAQSALEGAQKCRELGYSHTIECVAPGRSGIAVDVPSIGIKTQFAITVASSTARIEQKKDMIVEALTELKNEMMRIAVPELKERFPN